MTAICSLCPHHCRLEEGQTGFCRARANHGGVIVCLNYGKLTSLALDPIEKKPLRHFYPGSQILSVGSFGCNLRCPFCQNSGISMADEAGCDTVFMPPERLVGQAVRLRPGGNIGLAFTYNEPLVGFEYVLDCAKLAHESRLKTVLVTNGMVCGDALEELLPFVDAFNIDLKSIREDFYRRVSGDLKTVLQTIRQAAGISHVELTTLIIPGENDSEEEMDELAGWIASVNPAIPLHISRFFPCYHMKDASPTPVADVYRLAEVARRRLRHVYTGNC